MRERDIRNENPIWICQTPNEVWRDNPKYRNLIKTFQQDHRIPGWANFVKVRVICPKSSMLFTGSRPWWEDGVWQDKLFWVFHKPLIARQDNAPYPYYALEFYECQRIVQQGIADKGRNPFGDNLYPSLVVPVECCQLAWSETSAGYSDHLTGRFDPEPTEQEIELEALAQEAMAKVTAQIQPQKEEEMW